MNRRTRNIILGAVVVIILGSIWYLDSIRPKHTEATGDSVNLTASTTEATSTTALADRTDIKKAKGKKYPAGQELVDPKGFINTANGKPIHLADYVGKKVILVDFWTYSCINCERTIPYLNSWYDKYHDKGLMIVGVHTPEFDFEKDMSNVAAAVSKYKIMYPVVLDNNYGTWNAYANLYWPREYLIDIDGYIIHDHIGEGDYDKTEAAIQAALKERMQALGLSGSIDMPLTETSPVPQPQSPETYFGSGRNDYFGNGQSGELGVQTLTLPKTIDSNAFYLSGSWNFSKEFAENQSAGAKVVYKYKAKDVYMVASSEKGVKVHILIDGKPIMDRGDDVATDGSLTIKGDQLYKLVHHQKIEEHTIEIQIDSPGLDAYTFTFG